MNNLEIKDTGSLSGIESLRVHKSAKKIVGFVNIFRFRDKDTNQFLSFCPSLELTGYGETEHKALEMLKFSISDYFDYLIELSPKEIEKELRLHGFTHDKIKNKEYSKVFVEINGDLKNFNAVDDKVERLTLEAA
jgi:hypothetical protein